MGFTVRIWGKEGPFADNMFEFMMKRAKKKTIKILRICISGV
jgi:hypothetical protein